MTGSAKNNRENYPTKCFWTPEKETRVKFNPGLSANRLSNNWAQNIIDKNPCLRKSRLSNQKHVVYHMMVFGRFQVVCISRCLVRQQKLHLVFHRCRKGLSSYSVFSLTWPSSMQIYWNKRTLLHKKRVQLPQDWFGTHIWPPWRHVKTHNSDS